MSSFADRLLDFWDRLAPPRLEIEGVEILNPLTSPEAAVVMRAYYERFYGDDSRRVFVLGINPGRFGAGVTGVPFTDPVALKQFCGIESSFPPRREQSSIFIYDFMNRWGGVEAFTRDFYLTAICPFGFTRDGKNFNYYDSPALQTALRPYIVESMRAQLNIGAEPGVAIVLGTGKNARFFHELNAAEGLFERVLVVEHPRFIMQYRRREIETYLLKWEETFRAAARFSGRAI